MCSIPGWPFLNLRMAPFAHRSFSVSIEPDTQSLVINMASRLTKSAGHSSLTAREKQVLGLAASGRAPKTIAGMLGITKRAVDSHIQQTIIKLGAANRPNAVAIAFSRGIINLHNLT